MRLRTLNGAGLGMGRTVKKTKLIIDGGHRYMAKKGTSLIRVGIGRAGDGSNDVGNPVLT
jgi:hypothetical protein